MSAMGRAGQVLDAGQGIPARSERILGNADAEVYLDAGARIRIIGGIGTDATDQRVVIVAALQGVVAQTAAQHVAAGAAGQGIVAGPAGQQVGTAIAGSGCR